MINKALFSFIALFLFIFAASSALAQDKSCCADKQKSHCSEKADLSSLSNGTAASDTSVKTIVCIVSGEEVPETQAVNFNYYGKTYSFCCEGCLTKFKKEPLNYIKEELTCPVMGDKIESKDVFVMHNDTKYYLCCKSCLKKFKDDPEKYIK